MAVTQYIGARYVPLFDGIWDANKEYEPLTIVSYLGASYTSRQAVPVGVPIDNEAYWALTGNYNSQIEQYRQEVQQFDSRISGNADAIDAEESARASADAALDASIEAEVTAREAADSNLDSRIDALSKKTAIGSYLHPQHVGDFLSACKYGCVCKVGSDFVSFLSNDQNGNGEIWKCSTVNNTIGTPRTDLVGHANSCAYDSVRNRVWLVPMRDFNGSVQTVSRKLYWFNEQLTRRSEITTQFNPMGITFDSVTETLWAFDITNVTTYDLYKMGSKDDAFTLAATIKKPFLHPAGFGATQDIAAHGNMLILCDTLQNFAVIDLETFQTMSCGTIGNTGNQWMYGETEGIEFDEDGNLYQARISPFGFSVEGSANPASMCSVTQLITAPNTNVPEVMPLTVVRGLYLSAASQQAFANERYQIKTINAIPWLLMKPTTVNVVGNVTEQWPVYSDCSELIVKVPIGASLSLPNILQQRGKLVLSTESDVTSPGTINFTNSTPQAAISGSTARPASLVISNLGVINYSNERLVSYGYNGGIIEYWFAGNLSNVNINGVVYKSARQLIIGSESFQKAGA